MSNVKKVLVAARNFAGEWSAEFWPPQFVALLMAEFTSEFAEVFLKVYRQEVNGNGSG